MPRDHSFSDFTRDARATVIRLQYPGGPGSFDISAIRPTVLEDAADIKGAAAHPDDYGGLKLKCEAALADAWIRCAPMMFSCWLAVS